jgi:uncharacterized protein
MASPTIHTPDIPADGLHLERELQEEDFGLAEDDARLREPLWLSADITKAGELIHVRGSLRGTYVRQCVRCLRDYGDAADLSFQVEYHRSNITSPRRPKTTGLESSPTPDVGSEDDVYSYRGETVDLSEMLREQVILATPMQPLCSPDCQGLCPVCGRDRNVTACGCVEQTHKSPFAVLQDQDRRARQRKESDGDS